MVLKRKERTISRQWHQNCQKGKKNRSYEAVGSVFVLQEWDPQGRFPVGIHVDWDKLNQCQRPKQLWRPATPTSPASALFSVLLSLLISLPFLLTLCVLFILCGFCIISPWSWPQFDHLSSLCRWANSTFAVIIMYLMPWGYGFRPGTVMA